MKRGGYTLKIINANNNVSHLRYFLDFAGMKLREQTNA